MPIVDILDILQKGNEPKPANSPYSNLVSSAELPVAKNVLGIGLRGSSRDYEASRGA